MTTWDHHLITPEDMECSWNGGLGSLLAALVGTVRRDWPMLEQGIQARQHAEKRAVIVGESTPLTVELFHNPARLSSVIATPAEDAWCPLCLESVPPEEKGVAVGRNLVALPNPAPIIRDHVVFAHREHVPQALHPCLEDLAWLAAMAGEDTVLLYNGPTSGASSPYHLHLQAGRAQDLPLTGQKFPDSASRRDTSWGSIAAVQAGGRRFLLLSMADPYRLPDACRHALGLFQPDGEFPLNLVIWRRGAIHAALFPRSRHRPSCYFLPEDQRLVISPGSVEMAGLVVLPRRQDWQRMEPCTLQRIYREVCLDDDAWQRLLARLSS
ncbi:DUF4922 domain-containing protein [Candidatus Fermentibacteria bacterium]|nr:DUF4922 domain-containing protein [Candidatus Fermentibacteria bacterium]